jgi:hypothetical protein
LGVTFPGGVENRTHVQGSCRRLGRERTDTSGEIRVEVAPLETLSSADDAEQIAMEVFGGDP